MVAEIQIIDDGIGTNTLNLTGLDASSFSIVGNGLYLKAGTNLDFESKELYQVTVNVDDSTVGSSVDASATFELSLADINEAPVIEPQSFPIRLRAVLGAKVGRVIASDVDAGQSLTYAITGGNTVGAFSINATTGDILIANSAKLPRVANSVPLTITVTDSDSTALSSTAIVSIPLTATASMEPIPVGATVATNENNRVLTRVAVVRGKIAYPGQTIGYALVGSDAALFQIDATGIITVKGCVELQLRSKELLCIPGRVY